MPSSRSTLSSAGIAGSVAAATIAPTKASTKPRRVPAKNGAIRRSRSPSLRRATSLARLAGSSLGTAPPRRIGLGHGRCHGGDRRRLAVDRAGVSTSPGNVMQGTPGAAADSA